ncbi:helix-turn-helix transcriptional regulator [Streptomyces sp. V4-01]|uniref:Helix-turn-helix transcriptional regulator n=1 Tax=Actinacidiphila polyblastidii TaxID=3110430 RepID=A0ABU7PNF5_9ACTN|nr:helix-turn-helix transcriptional regulator [Streptomyces sp. V4-01]
MAEQYGTGRHGATLAVPWVDMEQPDWTARVGTTIAGEIRRYRLSSGMSAQQLSDVCAMLGAPIPRTVISNIENGRRTNVSVAEVITLAAALAVPPIVLIYPAGFTEKVEFMPDREIDPLRAIRWFSGEAAFDKKSAMDQTPRDEWALTLVRKHWYLENRISGIYRGLFEDEISHEPVGPEADVAREHALRLTGELKALRQEMVRRGLTPPKTYLQLDDIPLPSRGEDNPPF